jgi:hypothetical protein
VESEEGQYNRMHWMALNRIVGLNGAVACNGDTVRHDFQRSPIGLYGFRSVWYSLKFGHDEYHHEMRQDNREMST